MPNGRYSEEDWHPPAAPPADPAGGLEWQELNQRVMACRLCPRLVSYREETARVKKRAFRDWDYWGKPVPGFGDPQARLLVVGLAPGAHGSNRTGRMFTGDSSGDFLYAALYRAGMANQPTPISREDGLMLRDIYITAICRCVPPDNKPTPTEIRNCQPFLEAELALLHQVQGIVALGSLGFHQVLTIFRGHGHTLPKMEFGHNRLFHPGDNLPWLLASYHPSRQNTQTGRLTREMFDQLWIRAQALLV